MLSHELFLYIVFLLLPLTTQVKTSQETTQNAVKRFTLQDLLSSSDKAAAVSPVQQDASKTQTVDINSLLAAAQRASTAQQTSQFSSSNKPIDIDVAPDKNGNINLDDLPGLVNNAMTSSSANNNQDISMANLQSLLSAKAGQMVAPPTDNKVVKEELNIGKEKIELEAAGKRATRYALAKGPDGGLNLVPVVEGAQQTDGNKFQVLQPKGYEEKGSSRQQMQLTTLSQAMYSPFPSDQNTLHLHLKGKDGKDGKPGLKGPMGPLGPKGPEGPHGPKGDPGTCSSQINGLFECTPDELDSLSNRVDYLEKICHKKAPPPPFKPVGEAGTEGNPLPSCQAVYEKNTNSKSGAYWLMTKGVRFKTYCDFDASGRRGWTLVARVNGTSNDFNGVSNAWADDSVFNQETAADLNLRSAMKNHGWFLVKTNAIKVCFDGPGKDCAVFTHNLGMRLDQLFAQEYGITVEQRWKFDDLMAALGKSCDTKDLKKQWCGLNLANICHPEDMNPNLNPTNHIVRIGCIGAKSNTCTPSDYAIGLGVTSCNDGYGCDRVGPKTESMHWSCPPNYGAFDQTGYIYTWCEFMKGGGKGDDERPDLTGGWTLVARVKGQATDWSPISDLWANNETLNEGTAGDTKSTISMKNVGYNLIKSDVLLLCFTGRNTGCAKFTHNKNMPLQRLFANQYGVVPDEQYTIAPFMKAIGKSCDLSILRQSWCGMNLANVCDAKKANPNEKPPRTTHIVRIGCIGDRTATCFPDDYAVGIGVTSCKDGFGCSNVGASKNMHYRCDYVYGAFSQTAFIYVL